ncbi:FKBP-type peptidyl-prolyl cis-trans isomerase [Alkalimarinus sediminis]|uniref:Peptidyl-prolyl cis-trans isomerase n=1 Tax=Alkalimarinus sediminis TaxID=1632866 RepID=A0A9E8KPU7_9ALTE|nr:FKBP-type peptidyl-prolyl cis-trans isomerase [Alkalimarinus sediminis]UZW73897.1 FKBP-type peptidyl-prolyl cis-trans isomerase [Alkalimarinus sediminis]
MSELEVGKDTGVVLHFSLKLDDGSVVDSTFEGDAAAFEFGDGNLPAGFEELLVGMKAGEKGQWDVPPEKAFGMPNPNNQQRMKRSEFPADMELAEGLVVSFADANKSELPGVVAELSDDEVLIDFNHPLAGKTLRFEVQILSVTALGEDK